MAAFFSKDMSEEEFDRLRENMVQRQIAARGVSDSAVLNAMRKVPRHLFVPDKYRAESYDDGPLPIGHGQTISQPYIVASMTEMLAPADSKTVLEIGTGSGYQTAILAELFFHVHTVEYVADLSRTARKLLGRFKYQTISFYIGDGLREPPEPAQFDAIIATAAPLDYPEELESRLKRGGKLVIPVGNINQILYLVEKDEEGNVRQHPQYPVRFVTMQM
jgi:protein-L-isoaspartate(D-aspartate) O-methyltransferase